MKRLFLAPVVALAALTATADANAQSAGANARSTGWIDDNRVEYARARQSYYDSRRAAYDNGFREGAKQGDKDGRNRDRFAYQDEKTYQRADKGYHREFGDLERYRQSFRGGYSAGYSDAYQRVAPRGGYGNSGGYGNDRDYRRDGPYTQRGGAYPGGGYRYPGQVNVAVQGGLDDGYEKGVEDARKNRSFDPLRHAWYRAGDRHYEGRYGSREQYKDVYRRAFKDGYERGYREGRYR